MEQPRITQVHPRAGSSPLGPMGPLAHGPLEFKPHLCGDGGRLATEVDAARIGSSRMISGPPPRAHLQRGGGTSSGAGIGYPRLGRPPPRGAGNLVWSDGLGAGLHGVATQKTAAPPKKKAMGVGGGETNSKVVQAFQTFSKRYNTAQTFSNLFKPVRNVTKLLKPSQTFSNLLKPLQTSPSLINNFSKDAQNFSNLLKLSQNFSQKQNKNKKNIGGAPSSEPLPSGRGPSQRPRLTWSLGHGIPPFGAPGARMVEHGW